MAAIEPSRVSGLPQGFPSLRRHGVAVERFPHYVNTELRQHSVHVVLISVILRGRGRHFMGDEFYDEAGGSVAITHYGQKHDIRD